MNIEEHLLIRKAQQGDEEAFEVLTKRYYKRIFNHCFSVLEDIERAEDLTQETFIRAYNKLSQFHENSSFYTWIWRVSHNLSLNALKKVKRELPLKEEILSESMPQEDEVLFSEYEKCLTEKERQVFYLLFEKQLSQKEIAYQLGIPHGTVRSRLTSGKKKIRRYLTSSSNLVNEL